MTAAAYMRSWRLRHPGYHREYMAKKRALHGWTYGWTAMKQRHPNPVSRGYVRILGIPVLLKKTGGNS